MRKPAPVEVLNGTRYEVTPLGSLKGREVLVRLLNLLGPGLSQLIRTGVTKDMAPEAAAALFADLAARIADDDLRYLVDTFSPCTLLQAKGMPGPGPMDPQRVDDHFAGNYGELFLWLWMCIRVNFASFLAGVPGLRAALTSPSPAPSQSPTT